MKRLTPEFQNKDSRRILTQLLTTKDIKQINVYEANHGAILGNHFHKETVEYFYITRGTMIYNDRLIVRRGDFFVVYPPERHSLKVLSDKSTFLTFLTRPFSQENSDIYV